MSSEIETLHRPFQQWLATAGLVYDYSNPYRRTGAAFPGGADFVIHRNGRALMIEMKDKSTPISEDQKKRHADLLQQGTQVHIMRDLQDAVTLTVQWLSAMGLPVDLTPKVRSQSNVCRLSGKIYKRGARGGWDYVRPETIDDITIPMMTEVK